ncbi:unnamed protein product, partial [Brassica napus]
MINGLVSLVAHGIAEFESHYNGFKQVSWSHISSSDDQGPHVFSELGYTTEEACQHTTLDLQICNAKFYTWNKEVMSTSTPPLKQPRRRF